MEVIQHVLDWYMANLNYFTIFLLMAVESSFIPFPSEIVVPFAAWKAAEGTLSVAGVVLASTAGAMTGAVFNYYFALWLGRPVLYKLSDTKLAHWMMLDHTSIEKAEDYFRKHGKMSTFIGRLVPAVRQLISLPAGLAKMNFSVFVLFTFLGAGIWNIILAMIGYFAYDLKDRIMPYIDWVMYGAGILFVAFLAWQGWKAYKRNKNNSTQ